MGIDKITPTPETTAPTTSNSSNFNLVGGLIMVNATINGEPGAFILDTGAPSLVLNTKEEKSNFVLASSVSSSIKVGETMVENFQWGSYEKTNLAAYTLDISHMNGGGKSPDGLIGYQVLKNNAVMINFHESEITLLSKKDLKKKIKSSDEVITIPFSTDGHLPIIKLKINNKTYRFGLDTGAEQNLLNKSLFDATNPSNIQYELMQGLDGGIRKVAVGELKNLKSKAYQIDQLKFLYSDFSGITDSYEIDGLLGLPFFQGKTFVIDYRKNQLHIWK